ncbi:MAG: glycosyltransferase family 39 protein [Anaerolineae bacterium]|nr:glycosyltransferase family 39 protein [Anaerolineae bacterium]
MTQAVLAGDWTKTANNYPAVTLMWVEAAQVKAFEWLGRPNVAQMLSAADEVVFAALPRRRLVLALINSGIIFISFWLLRRIFNNFVAVTATILMALDPFLLTQARVFRTDGLNAGLMLLSVLAILLYAKEGRKRWLVASSTLGSLAALTKITSLYLLTFAGLTLLVWPLWVGERDVLKILKSTVRDVFWWALIMGGTFFVLWPALWVSPLTTFYDMYKIMQLTAENAGAVWGGEQQFFFWGEIGTDDPGILFYLWLLAYRTTPLVWLGGAVTVASLLLLLLNRWRQQELPQALQSFIPFAAPTLLIIAYVFFYFIAMNLGASKVPHYLLPIFPGLSILAAIGFLVLATFISERVRMNPVRPEWVWGILLVCSAWLALPHHPYYFSYWNPLLGGGRGAAKILPVGSGEGLDIMFAYLNTLPQPEEISLSGDLDVCYISRLVFPGDCLEESNFLVTDYFLLQVFAAQRETVKPSTVQAVRSEGELVQKFSRDGIDYAELYRLPKNFHQVEQWLGSHGRLLGYRPSAAKVAAGDSLKVTIFWENGEAQGWQLTDSEFFIKLLDQTGQVYQAAAAQLKPEFQPYLLQPGALLVFAASLELPQDIPLGYYPLEIGLRLKDSGQETWTFPLPKPTSTIVVNRGALGVPIQTLPIQYRLEQPAGDTGLTLLGYNLINEPSYIELYWQADRPLDWEYRVKLALLDVQGQAITTWSNALSPEFHPLTKWQPGEVVKLSWPLETGGMFAPGDYHLSLLLQPMDMANAVATINLADIPGDFSPGSPAATPQYQVENVTFGQTLDVLGYNLGGKGGGPAGVLLLGLYWLNRAPLDPLEAQVEVIADNGAIIAQQILPVPLPENSLTWQSVSHYELPLNNLPAFLIVKVRFENAGEWLTVQIPNEAATDRLIIDEILPKTVIISD